MRTCSISRGRSGSRNFENNFPYQKPRNQPHEVLNRGQISSHPGLGANPVLPDLGLGGTGAIRDEFVATLMLSHTEVIDVAHVLGDLGIVRIEFGSDAYFIESPEPGRLVLALLALVSLSAARRRRL